MWVKKIVNELQIESLDKLKNVTEQQVKDFLESINNPIQTSLRQVFAKFVGVGISSPEAKLPKAGSVESVLLSDSSSEKEGTKQHELTDRKICMSAAELLRLSENSVVFRGTDLYLNEATDESVEMKERVFDVRDHLQFSNAQSNWSVHQHKFTSREAMQTFLNDIGKTTTMEKGVSEIVVEDPTGCESREDRFLGYTHYKMVPVVSVELTADQVDLTPEVIDSLQVVEQSLKLPDHLSSNHFDEFFEKYGSHLSLGVIDFGNILLSNAICERFEEQVYPEVIDAVEKTSNRGILAETYEKVQLDEVLSAQAIFGEVSDMPSDLLQNITLTIRRIGSHQDAKEKIQLMEIAEDGTKLGVINKCTSFKPIWEMLQKYPDQFQDHKKLADTMMKEWTSRACHKQMDCFREELQQWINEYRCSNLDQIGKELKRLARIRHKYDKIDQYWAKEVLYLRKVQCALMQTVKFIMKYDREIEHLRDRQTEEEDQIKKQTIASRMRYILHVQGSLQENRFPNLRLITETIEEIEGNRKVEAFQIEYIDQLLEKWKDYKRDNNMNEDTSEIAMQHMQLKLETTLKSMEQHPKKTFEYLLFIGVLQICGFNTSTLRFGYQLSKRDLDIIFQRFEAHLTKFKMLSHEFKKQAYVFKLALYNIENKEESVLYLTKILAGRLDKT